MTQAEWAIQQEQNPEGFGQFVAIEEGQYTEGEYAPLWQMSSAGYGGVQNVDGTLWGMAPVNQPWTQPPVVEEEVQTEVVAETPPDDEPSGYEADVAANQADLDAALIEEGQFWDTQATDYTAQWTLAASSLEEDYTRQLNAITAMFATRRASLEQLNAATLGGLTKSGIRSGRQRYANEMQTSILSAEESAGIARVTALGTEELMLKADLESAIREKRWDLMNQKTNELRLIRANKKAELDDLRTKNYAENDRLLKEIERQRGDIEWEQGQFIELYKVALTKVDNLLASDVAITDMAAEDIAQLEEDLDLMAGTFETFYANKIAAEEAVVAAETDKALTAQIDREVKILKVLVTIPKGQPITIGGVEYVGMKAPKITTPKSTTWKIETENRKKLSRLGILEEDVDTLETMVIERWEDNEMRIALAEDGNNGQGYSMGVINKIMEILEFEQSLGQKFGQETSEFMSMDFPQEIRDMVNEGTDVLYSVSELNDEGDTLLATQNIVQKSLGYLKTKYGLSQTQYNELVFFIYQNYSIDAVEEEEVDEGWFS